MFQDFVKGIDGVNFPAPLMINDCILHLLLEDVLLEEAFLLFQEFYCFLEILHPDEDSDNQVDEL